jgi:hypothetical protein
VFFFVLLFFVLVVFLLLVVLGVFRAYVPFKERRMQTEINLQQRLVLEE